MNDDSDEHGRFTRRGGGVLPNLEESGSDTSSSKVADLVEKEIDQLIRNDRRTPKILKQILWLVLFAFLSTTIIAAIIMGLFVSDSQQTKSQIGVMTQALQRGTYCSQVMNLLRSLINHNLGYESDSVLYDTMIWKGLRSNGQQDIDTFLSQLIIDKLDTLKDRQQSLELKAQQTGDRSVSLLDISSLNSQGVREVQQQSPNVAINVLLSNIIDIVSNVGLLKNNTAKLNLTFSDYYTYYNQLIKVQGQIPQAYQYKTVELQKQVFFVFENYVNVLDQFNSKTADYYQSQGMNTLDDNSTQRFLILICISIGSLFIVLLLVSPVTFKIRRQKYQVLLFFLGLNESVVNTCFSKSSKFEEQFSDEQFLAAYEAEEEDKYTRQLMRKTRRQMAGGRQNSNANADMSRSRMEGGVNATNLNETSSESDGEGEGDDAEEFDFEDDYDDNSLKLDLTQDGDLSKSMIMAEEDQPVILRAPIGMSQLDAPLQQKGTQRGRVEQSQTTGIIKIEEIKLQPISKQSSSGSHAITKRGSRMNQRTATIDSQIPTASPFTAGGPLESNKRLKQKAVGFNRESLDDIVILQAEESRI